MMYLLLANLYLGVFYLFYHVSLRRETFFNWNRFYLLGALMLAFTLPLAEIPGIKLPTGIEQQPLFQFVGASENPAAATTGTNVSFPVTPAAGDRTQVSAGDHLPDLRSIYIAGCLVSLGLFLFRMLSVYRMIRHHKPSGAFSFFRIIRVDRETEGSELIHQHELVHAREWHSLDIMLMQITRIFNWFNPVVYLMERSLRLQHEYRADSRVARQDQAHYAELLLATALHVPGGVLTNQFINPTLLKSRIMMLLKNKTPKQNRVKFALVIPLIGAMVLLSTACNQSGKTSEGQESVESTETTAADIMAGQAADTLASDTLPFVEPPPPINLPTVKPLPPRPRQRDQVEMPEMRVVPADSAKRKNQVRMPVVTVTPADPKKDQVRHPVYPFEKVEIQPLPHDGSIQAFRNWFYQSLEIPQIVLDANFRGTVDASFIIEMDGKLSSFVTTFQGEPDKERDEALSNAIIETLKKSSDWRPGIHNGKPVRVSYTIPVRFDTTR